MRKLIVLVFALMLVAPTLLPAQDDDAENLISFNPFGLILGVYSGYYERKVRDDLGVYVGPEYFNVRLGIFRPLIDDDDFYWWSFGLSGGANYYFDDALTGFFVGGGPHLAYTAIGDDDVSVSGTMWGLHAHLGHRWIWGNFAFGPMVGLQYSRTTFDFGDVDVPDAVTVDGVSPFFSLGLAYAF